jgi:murein DD-endopeptidase MepM/ murein hydrolase activator NlpD
MAAEPFPAKDPLPPPELTGLGRIWADLVAAGWGEAVLRYATHGLLLLVLALAVGVRQVNLGFVDVLMAKAALQPDGAGAQVIEAAAPTPHPLSGSDIQGPLPPAEPTPDSNTVTPIERLAEVRTLIPTRGRSDVITYTVRSGDTLFGIADNFGLEPETVLWGNYFTLQDDPHSLVPGQVLSILPVNGTYHLVTEDNTLAQIARFYEVEPEAILDWGSNNLDPSNPVLQPGTYLVVPGGRRELQTWEVPTITRSDTTTAANNFGQCPGGYSGAVGTGFFVWPADNRFLSGYDFTPIHRGLDIKAVLGAPLYAADSGVIVYAGPTNRGYGNLVVIDHGNGYQTVYAHLSQWNVTCGESVFQGNIIGLSGSTGNSSGPHLHFEVRYNGSYVNPWTILP